MTERQSPVTYMSLVMRFLFQRKTDEKASECIGTEVAQKDWKICGETKVASSMPQRSVS